MKKTSTKKRPNLMQFTLSLESQKILDDFTAKYGTSKSMIIDRALLMLAGQYHRKILISYELLSDENTTTTTTTQTRSTYTKTTKNQQPINKAEEISDQEIDDIIADIEDMKKNNYYVNQR